MHLSRFYHNLPALQTPRLILRKLRIEDAGAYFAFAGDPQVTQYLRWGPHESFLETEKYIASVLDAYEQGLDSPWGIELAQDCALIGAIHLMEIDPKDRKADIGVVLARKYWGQGIGSEALNCVLTYCFNDLALNRVQGLSIVGNTAARRMMEKCGMIHEGVLRAYAFQKGKYQDFDLLSIITREYRETEGTDHHG